MHNFKLITKPSFFNPSKSIFPSSINQQHSPCKSCFNILNEKTEKPCYNCVKIDQYQHKYPIPLIKMGGIEDTEFGVLPILPTVRTYIAGGPVEERQLEKMDRGFIGKRLEA